MILFFYALILTEKDSVLDPIWAIAFLASLIWFAGMSLELVRRVGRDVHPARRTPQAPDGPNFLFPAAAGIAL